MATDKQDNTVVKNDVQLPAEPGATLPVPQGATIDAPSDKEVEKTSAQVAKARQAVVDAEAKARDASKTPEERAVEKAKADLSDAEAKHAELTGTAQEAAAIPMTVADAKVLAVVTPDTSAGDHRAQKFGNDPANPKLAPGISPTENLVKLSRKTPDIVGGLAYTEVPKEMVGDYERAGWNRA